MLSDRVGFPTETYRSHKLLLCLTFSMKKDLKKKKLSTEDTNMPYELRPAPHSDHLLFMNRIKSIFLI